MTCTWLVRDMYISDRHVTLYVTCNVTCTWHTRDLSNVTCKWTINVTCTRCARIPLDIKRAPQYISVRRMCKRVANADWAPRSCFPFFPPISPQSNCLSMEICHYDDGRCSWYANISRYMYVWRGSVMTRSSADRHDCPPGPPSARVRPTILHRTVKSPSRFFLSRFYNIHSHNINLNPNNIIQRQMTFCVGWRRRATCITRSRVNRLRAILAPSFDWCNYRSKFRCAIWMSLVKRRRWRMSLLAMSSLGAPVYIIFRRHACRFRRKFRCHVDMDSIYYERSKFESVDRLEHIFEHYLEAAVEANIR